MAHKQTPDTAEGSKKPKRKSVDAREAVRRGLSFGPLRSSGSHTEPLPPATTPTDDHEPSDLNDTEQLRSSNEASALYDRGEGLALKDHKTRIGSAENSEEEDAVWSSGDEGERGRSQDSKYTESSSSKAEGQTTISQAEVDETAAPLQKTSSKRFDIHPKAKLQKPPSKSRARSLSPTLSEDEEIEATRHAQGLPVWMTAQDDSVNHRTLQTLVRGDYQSTQKEVKDGIRRSRTYLAATDLSAESAYALEWAIGTVMRDGDTLIVVYAVDEAQGTGVPTDSLPVGEGGASMRETAAIVEKVTSQTEKGSLMPLPAQLTKKSLRPGSRKGSAATSTDSRSLSIAQQERSHALQKLKETCLGFLRKTGLQCRVVIEVIHCKIPKYMITEAVSRPCRRWNSTHDVIDRRNQTPDGHHWMPWPQLNQRVGLLVLSEPRHHILNSCTDTILVFFWAHFRIMSPPNRRYRSWLLERRPQAAAPRRQRLNSISPIT